MFDAIQAWDLSVLWWMKGFKDPFFVWAAWAAATLAWKGWLWCIAIVVAWVRGNRLFSIQMSLAMILCIVGGLSLKGVIQRPRPDLYASIQHNIPMPELLTTAHSFPSGHTLLAAAFAYVVFCFYKDYRAWLAMLFVGAVGASRVYQGLHWPTDIFGSVAMGFAAGALAGWLCQIPLLKRLASDGFRGLLPSKSVRPQATRTADDREYAATAPRK